MDGHNVIWITSVIDLPEFMPIGNRDIGLNVCADFWIRV